MSKPKLNIDAMSDELGAVASFAFQKPAIQPQDDGTPTLPKRIKLEPAKSFKQASVVKTQPILAAKSQQGEVGNKNIEIPRYRDTTIPTYRDEMIESIRKAVKLLGKEAATYRFTQEEKRLLADIIYNYKASGIKTSENEITRMAIHLLVEDYQENGRNSVLERVIERLND